MEGLEGLESFGEFWRVCGLANGSFESLRKAIAVAWPWGACWGSCLGPRVHVGEGVWNFGSLDPLQAGKRQL